MPVLWHCRACNRSEQTGWEMLIERLHDAGLLKRAGKQERRDRKYLLALALSVADRLKCPDCGGPGYAVSELDDDAAFAAGRPCAACGQLIPPERLELFPDTTLCTACQCTVDRGGTPDTQEYCPRCGTPMQVRAGRGAGVTRYSLVCPQCRR